MPPISNSPVRLLHTVNISGSERHDGEKPYTYVVQAPDLPGAKRLAWLHHLWIEISEQGTVSADQLDIDIDIVVIDTPEDPCTTGAPSCPSPIHYDPADIDNNDHRYPCRCEWYWQWHDWRPGRQRPISVTRLIDLGYQIPSGPCPEENT